MKGRGKKDTRWISFFSLVNAAFRVFAEIESWRVMETEWNTEDGLSW